MDINALLLTLPEAKSMHTYLLFEAGTQSLEDFRAFYAEHTSSLYSLYIHPQLEGFKEYGPWLLEVENHTQLPGYLDVIPGVIGMIVTHRLLSSVAIQLSRGCTVVGPDNHTSLVRFYTPHVLNILALSTGSDWHAFLFRDIQQWWIPGKEGWEQVIIPASVVLNPVDHIVRLEKNIWQQIADKPDVSSVLTQWQKMPSSQHFPPCTQRNMVIKALGKARDAGITEGTDNKLYALYYLNGGKKTLESDEMKIALHRVSQGDISLAQVLAKVAD